jgi:hypothetical protein
MADISAYMDDETGEFDHDEYESDQLSLMTPETINEGQVVQIDWVAPAHLEVEAWKIEILAADGYWYDDAGCDGSSYEVRDALSCTIDQASLKAFPFNLIQGELVIAKVIAYNEDGEEIAESDS